MISYPGPEFPICAPNDTVICMFPAYSKCWFIMLYTVSRDQTILGNQKDNQTAGRWYVEDCGSVALSIVE